jgi:hypothetical protein
MRSLSLAAALALAACAQPFDAAPDAGQEIGAMPSISRPTTFPRWATDGSGVEPTSGKKTTGFDPAERPAAQYFDWLFGKIYEWIKYGECHERELWIHAVEGVCGGGSDPADGLGYYVADEYYWASKSTGGEKRVQFRIPLGAGDRIRSLTVYGRAGNAAGEELEAVINRTGSAGFATDGEQVGPTKTSAAADGDTSIAWTTADTDFTPDGHEIDTGFAYLLDVRLPQTSGADEVKIYAIKIVWDRALPATD